MDARTPPLLGESIFDYRVHERMIPASGDMPALEAVETSLEGPPGGAPILFLHGAFLTQERRIWAHSGH